MEFKLDGMVVRENYNGWVIVWDGDHFFGEVMCDPGHDVAEGDIVTIGRTWDDVAAWMAGFSS